MTFQAYLDNIKAKTGRSPQDFHREAQAAGILRPGLTATQLVKWLADKYGLGRGHAMAIYGVFKDRGWFPPAAKQSKVGKSRAKQ